jgi:predicted kinase
MCGVSGSGKSYVAERLAPRLPAVRLRSDVARKIRAGLAPLARTRAEIGAGPYSQAASDAVYGWLVEVARDLVAAGEQVIVDAVFLNAARRAEFLQMADAVGADSVILWCDAPFEVLAERVRAREARQDDPSEAGLDVLQDQRQRFEPPQQRVLRVDTAVPLDVLALLGRLRRPLPQD